MGWRVPRKTRRSTSQTADVALSPAGFLAGFAAGFPLMIVAGPISMLLVDVGLGHGWRRGWRAAAGVAAADTTFAVLAVVAGGALVHALAGWEGVLRLTGAVALVAIAMHMLAGALRERRQAFVEEPATVAAGLSNPAGATASTSLSSAEDLADDESGADTERGPRFAPKFFFLSLANPMTILAFASIVLASGRSASGIAWVAGMGAASFLAHGFFVGAGAGLGSVLTSPRAVAALRFFGVAVVLGIAVHFATAAF